MSKPLPFVNNTGQYFCLISLDATELVSLALFACPISTINFFLLLRTSILHPNLKLILLGQSTCIFVRGIGRIMILAGRLWLGNVTSYGNAVLNMIFAFPSYFRNFLAHVLVVERAMATLFVSNYEHSRKPYFSLIWLTLITALVLANTLVVVNSSSELAIATWTLVFVLALIEVVLFAWIWRHNYFNFQQNLFAKEHSLTERYQLAENTRTGRQLIPTMIIHFFNITLGTLENWSSFAYIYGPYKEHAFEYVLMDKLFFCTMAITTFLIELTTILYHPYLRRHFLSIFCWFNSKLCPTRVHPSMNTETQNNAIGEIGRMNIRGEKVEMMAKNEADEHFQQLKRTWEAFEKWK